MGDFIDNIKDSVTDSVADKTGKVQRGMVPAECIGCPHRGGAPLYRCGLCGCPTIEGFPLEQFGMTPQGCPRITRHEKAANGEPTDTDEFR